jgi:hypothetical protein
MTPTTLRKALKARQIEPDRDGLFTLAQLVKAMLPEEGSASELSLRAHALLQNRRARLCELEIGQKEGSLIASEAAYKFLGVVLKTMFRCVWHSPLSRREQDTLCEVIHEQLLAHWVQAGWALTPAVEEAHLRNGDTEPLSRPAQWVRRINALIQASEKHHHETQARISSPEGKPRSARRRHRPTPGARPRALDSA